jgi:hypothetical protein
MHENERCITQTDSEQESKSSSLIPEADIHRRERKSFFSRVSFTSRQRKESRE